MKLTKLFSHACDEGGAVTRSYVRLFTNSRKRDFNRYYSYLYKNKMYSELNNLVGAMKMFGLIDFFKGLANKASRKIGGWAYGDRLREAKENAEKLIEDQYDENAWKSNKFLNDLKYNPTEADMRDAFKDYNPYDDVMKASNRYIVSNGGYGDVKNIFKDVKSYQQGIDTNNAVRDTYLGKYEEMGREAAARRIKDAQMERERKYLKDSGMDKNSIDEELRKKGYDVPVTPQATPQTTKTIQTPQAPKGRVVKMNNGGRMVIKPKIS